VGYASSSERLVRFGLGGQETVSGIEVRWPGGKTQEVSGVKADRVVDIEEGGEPRR
jgi:enediyne biosynthesis protein E4